LRGRKDTLAQVYFYWGGNRPPLPPRDRRHCFSIGYSQPRETGTVPVVSALCQLYRHIFVPCCYRRSLVCVCVSVCRSCCRFRDMTHHNQGHGGHAVRLELEFLAASRRSGSRSKSSSRSCSRPEVLVRAKVESGSDPDTYLGPDPNFDPGAWRFLYNSRASRF